MCRGGTLRGLLLNSYAFGTKGAAGIGAVGPLVRAAVMLVPSLLGFAHLRRVSPNAEPGSHKLPAQT
jgi:hypothetical protein